MPLFATDPRPSAVTPLIEPLGALRRTWSHYALAVDLVTFVFAVPALLGLGLSHQQFYLFWVPPVLIAGIVGGWGPGLLATGLSLVVHLYITGEYVEVFQPSSPNFSSSSARAFAF